MTEACGATNCTMMEVGGATSSMMKVRGATNSNSRNYIIFIRVSYRIFSLGGGDVVCGLTGMGEYFSQVTPRNGAKSIVVSFC